MVTVAEAMETVAGGGLAGVGLDAEEEAMVTVAEAMDLRLVIRNCSQCHTNTAGGCWRFYLCIQSCDCLK